MCNAYIIKNGTLVSILDGSEKKQDILIENGIISKIAECITAPQAEIIDAAGKYISVGWLDSHTHFLDNGIDIREDLLRQGVTYALDLGSRGPENYLESRAQILHQTDLKYLSYLNIARCGVTHVRMDFEGPEDIDPQLVKEVVRKYRHEFIGLKARIDDKFCFDPLFVMHHLRALGDELDMPIAVHAPRSRIGIDHLLPYLTKGDIFCHTLADNSDVMTVTDENGKIKQSVLEARERGVIFDLSHGTNAYSYDTAEAAWKAGFFVDTISSDLHAGNLNGPVFQLGIVLTKIKGLTDKPWHWILNKAIAEPVRLLNLPDKALEIKEGMEADLTVYKLESGEFTYLDSKKEHRTFTEKITPCFTCTGSHVYVCR